MKGLVITNKGIEDIAFSEIIEITGAKAKKEKGCVVFESEKFEDFFKLCYKSQTARKIILLLDTFKITSLDDIEKHVQKINLEEWINSKTTFVVRSSIKNEKLDSMEVEAETGSFIIDKTKAKVNLHDPDTTFFVFVEGNECYLGIDFSGQDLGKREYRIFIGSEKLKANVAYALVRASGFEKGKSLLDPFCSSGTIPIEAALFDRNFPVNFFSRDKFLFRHLKNFEDFDFDTFFENEDKNKAKESKTGITAADQSFNAIASSKKNAKIAGVQKSINFSRKEPEWLETKFKKESIDIITSLPPGTGRTRSEKQVEKILDELFYQADYILKKEGAVALLLMNAELAKKAAATHNFKVKEERKIMQGKEEFTAVIFEK